MITMLTRIHRTLSRPKGQDQRAAIRSAQESPALTVPVAPRLSIKAPPLTIPCPDPTGEDRIRDSHRNRALRLVRQEHWKVLAELIRHADTERSMTPGAMPVAELLAYGARADVVLAAEHALFDPQPDDETPLLRGIEALEYVLEDMPRNPVVAAIVAQTHIDIAWAWRGTAKAAQVAPRNREAFDAHFARAQQILQPFAPLAETSPLMAATFCALVAGTTTTSRNVADRYERLIDLNRENPGPMRAMGNYLLPRWDGSLGTLELEARRTAARTQDTWGAGGYTWVMFDAISTDDEACAAVDLTFFTDGLRDILSRRKDPHTANLLAAYCANTMGQAVSGNDAADQNRSQIAACAAWIVRNHLTELHPMIWAHAAQGFDNNLRIRSATRFAAAGQADAMRFLTSMFQGEIADGKQIVFTKEGPVAQTC